MSFIIPAKNEGLEIGNTLESIERFFPNEYQREVLVVDNGSTDATVGEVTQRGATVLDGTGLSLGALRNLGASEAQHAILVFLDADISLTPRWAEGVGEISKLLRGSRRTITGSWPDVPAGASWVARAWQPRREKRGEVAHLGTGHLILAKQLFLDLDGFDESLTTGEDYDLCFRARRLGVRIVANPVLRVIHRGEPTSLRDFFFRELWHGAGDREVSNVSPVAVVSLVHAAAHVSWVIGLLAGISGIGQWTVAHGGFIFVIISAGVLRKHGYRARRIWLPTIILVWVYYWARALSWLGVNGKRRR